VLAVAASLLAGVVAGGLGALLGIGGGAFLVPFLNLVVGLDFKVASAVSLVTVIATSSVTSATPGRLPLVNLRLGMVLEIFTTSGGLLGLMLFARSDDPTLKRAFAVVMAVVALVMLRQLNRSNAVPDTGDLDVGVLGGRYQDPHTGHFVAYRVKRLPVAFGVSLLAGIVSMLGVGGGVLKVPVLNAWCGVPMRTAAATSALMIAATAVVGSISYYMQGRIVPTYTAAAVLGVLAGSRVGFVIAARTKARGLKILMAVVLALVAIIYLVQ
jgi:uncharacterized membrane protein YfcA